jgi:hypothetical protein
MRRFGFFELAGLALLAFKFQGIVAGDASVVACAALSVTLADLDELAWLSYVPVLQTQQAAAHCKSEVTCHMVFSHRQVLV